MKSRSPQVWDFGDTRFKMLTGYVCTARPVPSLDHLMQAFPWNAKKFFSGICWVLETYSLQYVVHHVHCFLDRKSRAWEIKLFARNSRTNTTITRGWVSFQGKPADFTDTHWGQFTSTDFRMGSSAKRKKEKKKDFQVSHNGYDEPLEQPQV